MGNADGTGEKGAADKERLVAAVEREREALGRVE
jgi:hypothetical protein